MNENMKRKRICLAVIVTAAGMSSRMGDFKPLLPLSGKSFIEHILDHSKIERVEQQIVVLGKQAESIQEHLRGREISFALNPNFAKTDMFTSVKYGINQLKPNIDGFFVVAADMPLIRKSVYHILALAFQRVNARSILKPVYKGKGGHPILIPTSCIPGILNYQGDFGLKGALADQKMISLDWSEPSILYDADTYEDYLNLKNLYRSEYIPERSEILQLIEYADLPDHLAKHLLAVERKAVQLTEMAANQGYYLNQDLIRAGALLHDLKRMEANHEKAISDFLSYLDYPQELIRLVTEHMDISEASADAVNEAAIVYLADKMVSGDQEVSLYQRFQEKFVRYYDLEDARQNILRKYHKAALIYEKISGERALPLTK